jgi:hypothetical protein
MNPIFNLNRFFDLCRRSFVLNKQLILISIGGLSGGIFLILLVLQLFDRNYRHWNNSNTFILFLFLYIGLGIVYASLSFSGFRTKEKTINELMFPASPLEKYIFEVLSRLVLFIVIFPLVFWIIANLECMMLHSIYPFFEDYHFSFIKGIAKNFGIARDFGKHIEVWPTIMIITGGLLFFTIPFTGASSFQKNPLVKTLLLTTIIVVVFILIGVGLNYALDLENYSLAPDRLLFVTKKHIPKFISLFFTATNAVLLTISYFKIKEKEV